MALIRTVAGRNVYALRIRPDRRRELELYNTARADSLEPIGISAEPKRRSDGSTRTLRVPEGQIETLSRARLVSRLRARSPWS